MNDTDLRRSLEQIHHELTRGGRVIRRGYEYTTQWEFVLREGTSYRPGPLPFSHWRMPPRLCFANAIHTAVLRDLTYVEGFALHPLNTVPLAIHHAWNTDGTGRAIDATWMPPGLAYLGVEFSVERADDSTWNGDASVLDDFNRGWPILRERWNGEPEGLEWPPSPRLEIVRLYRDGKLAEAQELYWGYTAREIGDVRPPV